MQNIYDNKSKIYRQLFILLSSIFVFYIVLSPSETSTGNLLSLLIASFAGVVSIIYTILLLSLPQKYKVLTITLGFYLIKLGIGVFVYIFFIDTTYLSLNTDSLDYIWEYEWMHNSLTLISNAWNENYPLYVSDYFVLVNKNAYMFQLYGGLYYFGGTHVLNIAPYNALFMFLSSMLIYILTLSIWGNPKYALAALVIASLQPIHLISSSFDRHSVGLFLVLLAFFLITITSRRMLINIFLMFSAGAIAALMRKPYFIIPIIVFIYNAVGIRLTQRNILKLILIIGGTLLVLYFSYFDYIYSRFVGVGEVYPGIADKVVQFPKLFIKSLFGVFPWNQIFGPNPSREMLFQYMLQAPYNITMLCFSFIFLLTHKVARNVKSVFLYVILFFLSGVIAEENHIDYVSMSIPLLAIIVSRYSLVSVLTMYGSWICIFIIGSVVYTMLGFYGAGLFS
jgi:hypothetical protein